MASRKFTLSVDEEFSLDELAHGIERTIEEEGLMTSIENPSFNTYIINGTNVSSKGSRVGRTITGTVRSISVYLTLENNKVTLYFDHRAWADKATAYAFSWICTPLFFSASYGGIRQIYLEDKIIQYVKNVISYEEKEIIEIMNIKQRIMLATPIISLIIFLVMGFFLHMWTWGCLAFLLIPIMPIVLGEVSLDALYPIIVTVVYVAIGFAFKLWHPGWIIFLTIPVYYILFPKKIRKEWTKKYNY